MKRKHEPGERFEAQLDAVSREDAARLARETQKQALRDEWRDYLSQQPSEEELPTSSITSAVYRGALVACLRIAQGDADDQHVTAEGMVIKRKVSARDRVRAIEAIFKLRMEEARLVAEMRGDTTPQPQVVVQRSNPLTAEQAFEALQLKRKLALRQAG